MAKNRRRQQSAAAKPKPKKARARDNRPTQAERFEAARLAKRRLSLLVRGAVIATLAVLVGGLIVWRVAANRDAKRTIAAMTRDSCSYDTRSDPGRVNEHAEGAQFRVNPPSGGVHFGSAASVGTYAADTAPPAGQVVHSLEHGGIAIWYEPGLPDEELALLGALADANSDEVLLLPQAGLERPVAATAWHRRLLCDKVEIASLRRFVNAYGGEGPERGAKLT